MIYLHVSISGVSPRSIQGSGMDGFALEAAEGCQSHMDVLYHGGEDHETWVTTSSEAVKGCSFLILPRSSQDLPSPEVALRFLVFPAPALLRDLLSSPSKGQGKLWAGEIWRKSLT